MSDLGRHDDLADELEALGDETLTISAIDPETGERYEAPITRREWAQARARLADDDG